MLSLLTDKSKKMKRWPFFLVSSLFLIVQTLILYWLGYFENLSVYSYKVHLSDFILGVILLFLGAPFAISRLNDLKLSHLNYWLIAGGTNVVYGISGITERSAPGTKLNTSVQIVLVLWTLVYLIFSGLLILKEGKPD